MGHSQCIVTGSVYCKILVLNLPKQCIEIQKFVHASVEPRGKGVSYLDNNFHTAYGRLHGC